MTEGVWFVEGFDELIFRIEVGETWGMAMKLLWCPCVKCREWRAGR